MRRQAVHQDGDLALLSDATGTADQAVGVRGGGDDQRVARPRREMRVQDGERGVGAACEHEFEDGEVTCLSLGNANGDLPRRLQRVPCCRDVPLSHQELRFPGVSQGKTGLRGDRCVIGLGCAGIECQRQIRGLDVEIPRAGGRNRQGKAVAIILHGNPDRLFLTGCARRVMQQRHLWAHRDHTQRGGLKPYCHIMA